MKSSTPKTRRQPSIDLNRLADDFRGLDPNDPGVWPLAPRVVFLVAILVATIAGAWWFFWQDQMDTLTQREAEEVTLRADWVGKKRQSVNLDVHLQQLAEIDRQFGALLRQLPNRAEMDSLLADINQAGLGRGLQFELFKPGGDVIKEFYAEMPIAIRLVGQYHDLGAFAGDVAKMPRIVTLNNLAIERPKPGDPLKMDATAVTYRYLDEEELAQQQQAAAQAKKPR
ncbi:MAG TPA: type 4a pilus biogenesis protein PilO [Denitromonas sp.]|uniref:type 4a pilus biogenesis protein PilO n=1 Tax=Denitromonas sp. TaxID=2734609 RepID=UPI001D7A88B9|nr:type 4a pilus biogenesis protein PilO [Rhodocyclaceae bacterium]HPR05395.1 type 4a pilus biogenesis protein PilO [Denitromonas sp.]HQU87352.1 type 4a pilus biogenesis protein PilO [Denitromonas sp.]HQV13884.1 type 4a pilus biogenesis protein PilO [Denitromonas sp.]